MRREPLARTARERAEDEAFLRRYGPWAPFDPARLAAFMAGFERPWWIVGGWAIEAFTGVPREHEDIDLSILARDVPALRAHVGERWHLWSNAGGTLRPLDDRFPEVLDREGQVWVRAHARAPWVIDLPLTPDVDGLWSSKRMPDHVAPVEQVTWVAADGLRYLDPEIVLHYKARLGRPKDDRDLARTLPLLGVARRRWLRDAVRRTEPGHRWLAVLDVDPVLEFRAATAQGGGMSDDKSISVQRTIDAPSQAIFDVLSNPERHRELDGSGFVLGDEKSNRITGTGQVFRMNMTGDHMGGDYQTDNHVTAYDENHLIGWQTAPAGTEPPGWQWVWQLKSQGTDSTEVTLTYDWSNVTDKALLEKISFPLVERSQLEDSLGNLASAVAG